MLDRKTPPTFEKNTAFVLIDPERDALLNGLPVTFVHGGEQEVVKIEFIFKAGKWFESQSGVSYFTSHLLQKGTVSKSSYQIASAFDQLGIHLEINPGYDFNSIAVYGLSKNIHQLFPLILDILVNPTFPAIELQQTKDIYIQGLKINLEKTSYLASKQLRENLFGESHPYGRDASIEEVEKITQNNLLAFHQSNFGEVQILCSGKITPDLKKNIKQTFSELPSLKVGEKRIATNPSQTTRQLIDKEDAVQSSIRMGKKMIQRTHPDYPALLLLNHIFGGYFGSRLMKNIREEKGLTYGIYSSISSLINDCYLAIGADVNKENRELIIEEIKKEMCDLCTRPISSTELETARNHFIGGVQSEITTPFAHADKIKNIILHKLPDDYYQTLISRVDELSSNDLLQTAQQYYREDSFVEVTVG